MSLTRGIWGPPNMPPKTVQILARAIEKATQDPNFVKLVEEDLVFKVDFKTGETMQKEIVDFDKAVGPKFEAITK
jgi:tripartite-type tricarboxylate transporter receptor subunit TctC